jgi:serine protease Do
MKSSLRARWWVLGMGATLLLGASIGAAKFTNIPAMPGLSALTTPVVYTPKTAPPISDADASRAAASAKDLSTAFRVAADRVLSSLVTIETTVANTGRTGRAQGVVPRSRDRNPWEGRNPFEGTPFEDMFPDMPFGRDFRFEMPQRPEQQQGMGSGVIFDGTGLIMTNSHVVAGGQDAKVLVRLSDGREYMADEVWADPKTDIAVVKISSADDLVPAQLADSDQVSVGDWVLALGQPFGLERTVTAGIISATHRGVGINARESFLQTDAAINPGNSGGPLVNLDGHVVGINTAISSRGGGNDGVGFAVPINLAKWVAGQLADGGVVRRAYLGVGIQAIDAELAKRFGVKPRQGVLVTEVHGGTPASKAGLKSGDVIVEYAGVPIANPQDLQVIVERSELGRKHELLVVRDGQTMTLGFAPEEQPADFGERAKVRQDAPASPSGSAFDDYGFEVSDLDSDVAEQLGLLDEHGVVITRVKDDSVAARSGLKAGMVIVEIERKRVDSVEDCTQVLKDQDAGSELLLRVSSEQGSRYVVLKP